MARDKEEKQSNDEIQHNNENQKKKATASSRWKWLLATLGVLAATVGVPFLINICYRSNKGYITVWNGADVLSYYGTIISSVIGAIVVVLTVVYTISFNRKQIQQESYIKGEQAKWEKIENLVEQALDRINPRRVLLANTQALARNDENHTNSVLSVIQAYQFDCRVATDYLYPYIGSVEHSQVELLVGKMQAAAKEFYEIAQKEFDLYQLLRSIKAREIASRLVENEAQLPNVLTNDERILALSILEQTKDLKIDSVQAEIEKESEKMVRAYETTYRPLLTLKRQQFDTIYGEAQKNADEILHFRKLSDHADV